VHRWGFGLQAERLADTDVWLGHTKEASIIMTFVLLSLARYKKYCTQAHMVSSVLFYLRVASVCLYFFVGLKPCLVYALVCLGSVRSPASFILVRFPVQRGKHRSTEIASEEDFERLVRRHAGRKKQDLQAYSYENLDMAFVEFYAPFAESCKYVPSTHQTRSIWAGFSLKYATSRLRFFDGTRPSPSQRAESAESGQAL